MSINQITKMLYNICRILRDVNSVTQSVKQGTPMPLFKRIIRKFLGRQYGSFTNRLLK